MKVPRPISNLTDSFQRLPGIGPKSAQRIVFYLLHFPYEELEKLGQQLIKLKTDIKICSVCKHVGETDPCEICTDVSRDNNLIAVVSGALDVFALERSGYRGKYHVLHGLIDPLNNIGPEELFIDALLMRLKDFSTPVEVIMATDLTMEGESTAMYITRLLRQNGLDSGRVKVTRLARGMPAGGDIEYADDSTLHRAIEGRISMLE